MQAAAAAAITSAAAANAGEQCQESNQEDPLSVIASHHPFDQMRERDEEREREQANRGNDGARGMNGTGKAGRQSSIS